jgi:hypothetical protein
MGVTMLGWGRLTVRGQSKRFSEIRKAAREELHRMLRQVEK